MTPRQQLIEALARAWVRGGTPADDARRIAEEYVRDPAALAHLGHVLLTIAAMAGGLDMEDRQS